MVAAPAGPVADVVQKKRETTILSVDQTGLNACDVHVEPEERRAQSVQDVVVALQSRAKAGHVAGGQLQRMELARDGECVVMEKKHDRVAECGPMESRPSPAHVYVVVGEEQRVKSALDVGVLAWRVRPVRLAPVVRDEKAKKELVEYAVGQRAHLVDHREELMALRVLGVVDQGWTAPTKNRTKENRPKTSRRFRQIHCRRPSRTFHRH